MEEHINSAFAPIEDFALLVANLDEKIEQGGPLSIQIESVLSALVKNAKAEIMSAVAKPNEA